MDVIHLQIGEPDFDTPSHIVDAACEALRSGQTHYTATAGTPELREAAARYLSDTLRIDVSPQRLLVGNGSKPFLFFTILATCEPGDEVVIPDPAFPIYESAVRYVGAVPRFLRLREELDFSFDLDELAALVGPKTKLVILNSPHNPTGAVLPADAVAATAEIVQRSAAWVLSDEVYSQLIYDREHHSIASIDGMGDRTVLLDGFSKSFAMTGWRCGFAAVPDRLVDPLTKFFVNSTSCVPPFVQLAGVAALEGGWEPVDAMRAAFRRRRDVLVAGINEIDGFSCRTPGGAFYAFPNVSRLPIDAGALARRLLEEAGVALVAGSAFGPAGNDFIRFSYANSEDALVAALARIRGFTEALTSTEAAVVG
jgi:aspartate/methionine/tyrosine aminotransferase